MALKGNARKTYKTMRGRAVDMDLLQQRNELTPAVGNARINARGDELGPGGKIIRKKEDVMREYYNNSNRVPDEPNPVKTKAPVEETAVKPGVKSNTKTRAQQKAEEAAQPTANELAEFNDMDDGWVEDDNGNFVPKGE
jgi:hypothetical protein